MKTFAYLALIGTTLAIRLTETTGATDGAADQATLEQQELEAFGQVDLQDVGSLTIEDLGEEGGECLREATRGVLADAGLGSDDVDAVDEALTAGALERDAEGKPKNDLADFAGALDQVGRAMGGDTDDIEEGLRRIAKDSVECLKKKKGGDKKGKKQGGDRPAPESGDDAAAGEGQGDAPKPEGEATTTLAQAPTEEMLRAAAEAAADKVEGLDEDTKRELKKRVKKAAKEAGLDKDDVDRLEKAVRDGDAQGLKEAFEGLPEDKQDEVVAAVETAAAELGQ